MNIKRAIWVSACLLVILAPITAAVAGGPAAAAAHHASVASHSAGPAHPATIPSAPANPFGPRPVIVPSATGLHSQAALDAALGGIFAALLIIFGVAFTAFRRDTDKVRVRRRLSIYTLTGKAAHERQEVGAFGESAVARSAVDLAGRVVQRGDFETRLGRRLEGAGLPLRPAEWLLIHSGIAILATLVLVLVTGGKPLAAVIGLVVGILGPLLYLTNKETKRTSAFLTGLPDTLQLLAGSLSVGYSLAQAVDAVVREGTEPIAGEFNKALVEARLGLPIEDALDAVADRMRSRDFGWVVMAIRVQRQVGGNLAEVLTNAANTLRERDYLRRQVRVLSSEGRLSAVILYGLPFVFAGYLALVRPTYLRLLYTDTVGIVLIFMAVGLMIVGGFWLKHVVKVEV